MDYWSSMTAEDLLYIEAVVVDTRCVYSYLEVIDDGVRATLRHHNQQRVRRKKVIKSTYILLT
jgi:hypothetical protein